MVPLLGAALASMLVGLIPNFAAPPWQLLLWLGTGCLAVQFASLLMFGRKQGWIAPSVGGLVYWAIATIYFSGLAEFAAACILFTVAIAVGSVISQDERVDPWLKSLCGLVVIGGLTGWLLPFPIHDTRVYFLIVSLVLVLRREPLVRSGRRMSSDAASLIRQHPLTSSVAILLGGVATVGLWLPTVNYDDQSYHLIMPNQLLLDGYYHLDVSTQVWALAPWLGDVIHSWSALLVGDASRASAGLLWLVLGAVGAFRLALVLGASTRVSVVAAVVYATHPLTTYFGSTMQVDGPLAVVLMHFAAYLVPSAGEVKSPWILGSLIGAALSLKVTSTVFLFGPCLYLAWQGLRGRQYGWLAKVILASVIIGGSSYFYSFVVTGNPVFPLYNAVFESPYFPPINFADDRWHVGLNISSLWDITFHTDRYMEAYPGAAGLSMLALVGGIVVAATSNGAKRWLSLWFLAAGIIMFAQVQYFRYAFPCIAVLCTISVASISLLGNVRREGAALTAVWIIVILNLSLLGTTSWIVRDGTWNALIREGREYRAAILTRAAPTEPLLNRLSQRKPKACTLIADPGQPFIGALPGQAISTAWYDPQSQRALIWSNGDLSGDRWEQTLRAMGVSHLLLERNENEALLRALQNLQGHLEDREGAWELWSLGIAPSGECQESFLRSRDRAHRLLHPGDTH